MTGQRTYGTGICEKVINKDTGETCGLRVSHDGNAHGAGKCRTPEKKGTPGTADTPRIRGSTSYEKRRDAVLKNKSNKKKRQKDRKKRKFHAAQAAKKEKEAKNKEAA